MANIYDQYISGELIFHIVAFWLYCCSQLYSYVYAAEQNFYCGVLTAHKMAWFCVQRKKNVNDYLVIGILAHIDARD